MYSAVRTQQWKRFSKASSSLPRKLPTLQSKEHSTIPKKKRDGKRDRRGGTTKRREAKRDKIEGKERGRVRGRDKQGGRCRERGGAKKRRTEGE